MDRRWRLLWLVLIVGFLTGCDVPQEVPMPTANEKIQSVRQPVTAMTFPYEIPDSALVLESLECYSGPFWEDGSGKYVENVAALMICNPTNRMVEFAALAVEQNGQTLYFFAYALPPQSRCLALEYTGKKGTVQETRSCRELYIRWDTQTFSREQIDYLGLGTGMTIINRDGRQISHVTVRYKQYVQDGEYYLGGAVHRVHLFSLQPEERRTLWPEHYDASHARIVEIELEM